jgi:hypothetical protein
MGIVFVERLTKALSSSPFQAIHPRSRARPARSTLYMVAVATALLALALLWPMIEPQAACGPGSLNSDACNAGPPGPGGG